MSARKGSTDINEFLAGLQGDPEFDAEVRAIRPITNLAINVNRLRNAAGLSQADLARATGTTQPAISRCERGEANLRLTTVARLAGALGVDAADLLADPPSGARDASRSTAPAKRVAAPGRPRAGIADRGGAPAMHVAGTSTDRFLLSA